MMHNKQIFSPTHFLLCLSLLLPILLYFFSLFLSAPQAVHCTKISSSSTFTASESGTFEGFNIDNYEEDEDDDDDDDEDNNDHQENDDHTLHPSFYELLQKHNTFRYLEQQQQRYINRSSITKTEIEYPKITTENEYSSYRDDGWTARQVIFKLALIISIAITIYRCCRAGKRRQSFRGGGNGNTVRGNSLQNELAVVVVHRGGNSSSSSSSALERVYAHHHHQQTLPRNQINENRFASDNNAGNDDQHFPGDQEEEEEEVVVSVAMADSPPTYEEALKSDENQIIVNYQQQQQQQQQKPPPPYSSDL